MYKNCMEDNDPYVHRFTQPDSLVPNLYSPQSLNRYGYVVNNPVRYNDPTGHMCSDPDDLWSPMCDGSGATKSGDHIIPGSHVSGGQTTSTPSIPSDPIDDYSDWNSGLYGNCFKCHVAVAQGNTILTNSQLIDAYDTFYENLDYSIRTGGTIAAISIPIIFSLVAGLPPTSVNNIDFYATEDGVVIPATAYRYSAGEAGEIASGIIKNTTHIESITQTASYRIPDQLLTDQRLLSEVKNVSYLSFTNQINDYLLYAQKMGYTFELWTRSTTTLSGPLQNLVDSAQIIQRFFP
jgi:Restriction endonuclease fold toxin 7